ncbi:polyprenol monophosphomannose synthase [Verrucomicrobiota bacterium]
MNDTVIIIPTYDERDNVRPISEAIFQVAPQANILFVDDNSPDGTGRVIDELSSADKRIRVIHKEAKSGLGRAYISGFKQAIQDGYKLVFGMDADFSHDPVEIPNFIKAAENADMVLGSRYIDGIRITNWPLSRLLLSKTAATYVRIITGIPIADPTGGYRCYRREVLTEIDLDTVISNGYSFLVEMAHTAWMKGFRIKEVPITFEDRRAGYSKMNLDIFRESLWIVWKLAFRHGFRRRPMK